MKLDAGLDAMEDGYVTEAEQVDQETEIEDMQSLLDDDVMNPDSFDSDMEEAYRGFHDNEGFKDTAAERYDSSQLADAVCSEVGLDLSEEGFHVEDGFDRDLPGEEVPNSGRIGDYDADELSNEVPVVTMDEAEPIDYGFDIGRYSSEAGDMNVVEPTVSETKEELNS